MSLFRNFSKLAIVQSIIETALSNQLIMSTLFDNTSVFHNKDQIRITNRGETMGNDKACSALHHSFKCFLNL